MKQTLRLLPRLRAILIVLVMFSLVSSGRVGFSQPDSVTFDETGQRVSGLFLKYWQSHGGLAQQGYPISGELHETSPTDGKTYTMQYFERAVFELHPGAPVEHVVQLSLLGVFRYEEKYPNGAPGQVPNSEPGSYLFPETGKRAGGIFLEYWQEHGGLAQQGYPISDEFTEVSDLNGKPYKVQYFERAVFEYHPENSPPYNVLLSQLGTLRYRASTAGRVVATIPLGRDPGGLALGGGFLWVTGVDGTLFRIDPSTNRLVGEPLKVDLNRGPTQIGAVEFGAGSVWVLRPGGVLRIDPTTLRVVASIEVASILNGLLVTDDAVWITLPDSEDNSLVRIDPSTNSVIGSPIKVGERPYFVAAGAGSIWTGNHDDGTLSRIDPHTNSVIASIQLPIAPHGLTYGEGSIWVSDLHDNGVFRLDPATNQIMGDRIPLTFPAAPIAVSDGAVWVGPGSDDYLSRTGDDRLARIDPNTRRVIDTIHVGGKPVDLLVAPGTVWVAVRDPGLIVRIDTTVR